ncbi:unnamed protein product [Chrysoparadoxa australica]
MCSWLRLTLWRSWSRCCRVGHPMRSASQSWPAQSHAHSPAHNASSSGSTGAGLLVPCISKCNIGMAITLRHAPGPCNLTKFSLVGSTFSNTIGAAACIFGLPHEAACGS